MNIEKSAELNSLIAKDIILTKGSKKKLAKNLGLTPFRFSKILHNAVTPNSREKELFAKYLKVSIERIFD